MLTEKERKEGYKLCATILSAALEKDSVHYRGHVGYLAALQVMHTMKTTSEVPEIFDTQAPGHFVLAPEQAAKVLDLGVKAAMVEAPMLCWRCGRSKDYPGIVGGPNEYETMKCEDRFHAPPESATTSPLESK